MPRRSIDRSTKETGSLIDMKTGARITRPSVPIICERIRFYRERAGLEQKALAAKIGVTSNAVSNWENGRGRPDLNLLPSVCSALEITLYELFGEDDPSVQYTAEEQALLAQYRELSSGHRHAVEQLIGTLLRVQSAENMPPLRKIPFFARSLAAGRGDPTEFEQEGTPLYLYASQETDSADCVFSVGGDSMEPAYHSGDMVLVSRIPGAPELQHGEVGAFICGNETYIKVFAEDGLHSLNPAYPTIHFSDFERVYLIGRVTGILAPAQIAPASAVDQYLMLHPEER